MTNNYDIEILDNRNDIKRTFSNVNDRGLNILYSKVLVNLKLGVNTFNIPYDTSFISNRNELMILLNERHQESLRNTLDKKNINYHEVTFQDETFEYMPPQNNKKIIFVRGIHSLKKTLQESKKKGIRECIYYPRVKGRLNLKYYLRDDSKETLISKDTHGLIEFKDKIVLFLKQDENRNIGYSKALKLFDELNMIVEISEDYNYESIRKEKEFIKK